MEHHEAVIRLRERLAEGASFAAAFADGQGNAAFFGNGVKPLLNAVVKAAPLFFGATCADKVVGKAAALLLVYAKAGFVYAETISEPALKTLNFYKLPCAYGQAVPYIQNRDGTGQCPMETLCANTIDPNEAFRRLRERLNV